MKESSLQMARRHLREAENRVTRQARAVAEMRVRGHDTEEAEHLLGIYSDFLQIARDHLQFEENEAAQRGGGPPLSPE